MEERKKRFDPSWLRMISWEIRDGVKELEREKKEKMGDRWVMNCRVYIDPEIRCPGCGEGVRLEEVWFVDEKRMRVLRVIGKGDEDIPLPACHPHVDMAGNICMGDAPDVDTALWTSLYVGSAYYSVIEWLVEKGHRDCEELNRLGMSECYDCGCDLDPDEEYWEDGEVYCSECYWKRWFICERCSGQRDREDEFKVENTSLCQSCFDRVGYSCYQCGMNGFSCDAYSGADDNSYCQDCWNALWAECEECWETDNKDEITSRGGVCEECQLKREKEKEEEEDECGEGEV